jgi:hypothetical protein
MAWRGALAVMNGEVLDSWTPLQLLGALSLNDLRAGDRLGQ